MRTNRQRETEEQYEESEESEESYLDDLFEVLDSYKNFVTNLDKVGMDSIGDKLSEITDEFEVILMTLDEE